MNDSHRALGKLLILSKYIFLIYGQDIYESRKHIHVTHARRGYKRSCKIWLEPQVEISRIGDFTSQEIREILVLTKLHHDVLISQLKKFYNFEKVKAIRL